MENEFQQVANETYQERVFRARRMTPEERVIEGLRMFDVEQAELRAEFARTMPGATEAELSETVRQHFNRIREEERGPDFYERLRYLPAP